MNPGFCSAVIHPSSQLVLRAPMDGKVAAVNVVVGKQVAEGTKIIVMEEPPAAAEAAK